MADQVYLGTIFTNNDPDTGGLKSGDVVQLDPTMDNAVIKVTGANSDSVIGVVIVGASKHSQVTICGFTGQRIRLNIDGGATVARGDQLVSDGTILGNCKVDNAALPDQVFAVAIAAKTGGVGSQVEALYLAPAVSNATGSGAAAGAYYLVTRSTNAPINAVNLGALTTGFLKATIASGIATITTDSAVGAPETSKYILQQPDGSLPNAQALSALTTGLLKSTTTTGVVSTAIVNTDYPSVAATYLVSSSVAAPPSAQNLGLLTSGLLKQTVVSGVATVAIAVPGTDYLTSASLFYQTLNANGTTLTQRQILNFSTDLPAVDNSGATRTDISLLSVGPGAGTYGGSGVSAVQLDAKGRTIAVTAGNFAPASWALTGAMVVAVDGTNGNDANTGFAISPDLTQANIQIATVAAAGSGGVNAKKTLAGAAAVIPQQLAGRSVYIIVSGGTGSGLTYTDPWTVFDRSGGTVVILGTGTKSNAGATAFTGTTNDLIYQGAQTSTGMNATGYHPVSSTTSNTIQLVKVGGGSPGFSAEPGKPLFVRARWDVATPTTAQQNKVYSVVQVVGADTIVIQSSIAFTSGDILYLEDPGPIAPGGAFTGTSLTSLYGVQASTSLRALNGNLTVGFVHGAASLSYAGSGALATINSIVLQPFPTVGPSRFSSSVFANGGSFTASDSTLLSATTVSLSGQFSLTFGKYNYVGTDVSLIGINAATYQNAANFGAAVLAAEATRIGGTVTVSGSRLSIGSLNLFGTSKEFGVAVVGTNDINVLGTVYGVTKNNAGWDFSHSINSRLGLFTLLSSATIGSTLTGTNGDIYYGGDAPTGNPYLGSVATYLAYSGLDLVNGSLKLPNGDQWNVLVTQSIAANTYSSWGNPAIADSATSYAAGDISAGKFVVFKRTDGRGVVPAIADNITNVSGTFGMSLGISSAFAGFVVVSGTVFTTQGSLGGSNPVYISAATAGLLTVTAPVPPNVVRQIGWMTSANQVLLTPDNNPIYNQTVNNGASALTKRTILHADGTTIVATDVGSPNYWTNISVGTVPAASVSGLFYQTIAETGTNLTQRSILNFDGTVVATDSASPARTNVGLPSVGPGAGTIGSAGISSITLDINGRVTAATTATYAIAGNYIVALTGDVTATGPGTVAATIAANAVTNAKFRQSAAHSVVGNSTGSTANVTDNAVVAPLSLTTSTLALVFDASTLVLGGGTTLVRGPLTGDVTASSGFTSTTIANNVVTYAKMQQAGALTVIGRSANSTGNLGEIAATAASGAVLRESGSTLGFGTIATAGLGTNIVTYAKIQQVSAVSLLGNPTGSAANVSEITLGSGLSFSGTTLIATGSGGTVTSVTGSSPIFSSGGGTPNITIQGAFVSGSASTTAQNLGSLSTGILFGTVASSINTLSTLTIGSGLTLTGSTLSATASGSGTVTVVTATGPIVITSTPTTTPNVTIQGSIVSGSTSTSAQNLGALGSGLLLQTVSSGISTLSIAVAGTDYVSSVSSTTPIVNIGSVANPDFALQGSLVSGSSSTTPQNLGTLNTGLLKQTVASGIATIANATAGTDYQDVITWPASPRVLISGGISATPVGDSQFTYNTGTHTLTSAGTNNLSQTSLSGITTLSSLAGAATLLCMDISGVVQPANVGSGLAYSSGNLTAPIFIASGGSHSIGIVPDPGGTAGTLKFLREDATWVQPPISITIPFYISVTASVIADSARHWMVTSSISTLLTTAQEYAAPGFKPAFAQLVVNGLGGTVLGGAAMEITMSFNGSASSTSITLTPGSITGVHSSGTHTTLSTSTSDTFGVYVSALSGALSGTIIIACTLTLSSVSF